MTIKPAVARALRDVRARMRDVAAAEHANAAEAAGRAAAEVDAERARLAAFVDNAGAQLARASSVHDLDRVAALFGAHRDDIATAQQVHAEKRALADLTSGALRERTRQLKTAERIVDDALSARASREARGEQRTSDDLAGSRK